jgi:hypothetical protein
LPLPYHRRNLQHCPLEPRCGTKNYLKHFNEVIMLLEMIPDMPECTEDFLAWSPLSYAQHFTTSNFKTKELAISAYEAADPDIRAEFDQMTETATSILKEVGAALVEATRDESKAELAQQAIDWLKPLVAAAGVIDGGYDADVETIMAA